MTPARTARNALLALVLLVPAPAAFSAAPSIQPERAPTPESRRIDLRPKFRPGQQTRYTMEIDSTNDVASAQMPELDQKQKMRQELTLLMRVVEAGSDGSTVQLVYERVKVEIDSEGFSAAFDSAGPASRAKPSDRPGTDPKKKPGRKPRDPGTTPEQEAIDSLTDTPTLADMSDDEMLATAMQGIAGTVVTIEFDAAGNITKVSGADSLTPGNGGMGGPGGAGGLSAVGGAGGGSWMISSPGQTGFASVGETWSTTSSLGGTPLGDFQMVTRYTLRAASGNNATIAVSGGIESATQAPSPGGGGGGGLSAQIKESRYSGQCQWDTGRGELREMTTTQSATIEGVSMGVPMTMKSSTDTRVRRSR